MKARLLIFTAMLFAACFGAARNAEVTAAEERERKKPLLVPPGGRYYGEIEITVVNSSGTLEYSAGSEYMPLTAKNIRLTGTAVLRVRVTGNSELVSEEKYTIEKSFQPPELTPPAGKYTEAVRVSAAETFANTHLEIETDGAFKPYDPASGILVAESRVLRMRECIAAVCSAIFTYTYEISSAVENPPVTVPRLLTAAEIQSFVDLARNDYNQNLAGGLAAQMDAAKLFVIQDSALMPSAAMRQRFLSQNNATAAAEACTTVARYLYVSARRVSLGERSLPALPDFPRYYIRHIVRGDITVDSGGQNYVWVANGVAPVTQYLPEDNLAPFEFQRGVSYPTDYSLIDKLVAQAPITSLLRDGPSGSSHTHTFFALKTGAGYTMIDTYFTPFNGIELKASAGKAWPYGFRFGPAGSRYLHFTYGY